MRHRSTYLFNCGEHTDSWIRIRIQVQVRIDYIRINIRSCIVVVVTRERPGDIVLIVPTSRGSFLAFGP